MITKENFSDCEFETLLNKYDYSFKKGDLVKGIVWSYDSEGVIVDIGSKTSAIVPTREAKVDNSEPVEKVLEKGKEYEFWIIKEDEKVKEADEVIMGEVASCVKGGVLVDILGIRGFVPSSHLKFKDGELK